MVSPDEGMKVLQVITDRDRRGAQVFATDLETGLRELGAEVETVALTRGSHGDLLPVDALGPSRRSLTTLRELRRRAKDSDIVVAHGSSTLLACAVALMGSGTPFVYRQISDPLHWAASLPRRLRVALMLRRASAVVVLSPSIRRVFGKHYRIPDSAMTVIPNAVPGGAFAPAGEAAKAAARADLGIGTDALLAVYIGALAEEKGVELAVRAAAAIAGCHLAVVGDGPQRAHLERLAAEVAADRIRFTGPVPDAAPMLAAADVLLLPSRGGDSMPAVLIEAGLCGVPSISTPVGAIADVVLDGTTGCIVSIGDQDALNRALIELANDPQRRHAYGVAAEHHCREHFTIEATAPLWLQLLSDVARAPLRTGPASAAPPPGA